MFNKKTLNEDTYRVWAFHSNKYGEVAVELTDYQHMKRGIVITNREIVDFTKTEPQTAEARFRLRDMNDVEDIVDIQSYLIPGSIDTHVFALDYHTDGYGLPRSGAWVFSYVERKDLGNFSPTLTIRTPTSVGIRYTERD